jgi:ATP phosphoribosyltransferase
MKCESVTAYPAKGGARTFTSYRQAIAAYTELSTTTAVITFDDGSTEFLPFIQAVDFLA